ncbi:hypothetical protein TI05_01875 [Achromatium sp. WMS3]|nr:hypothetical protein TI05_01875 [Achromatium sp. WMS3]
MSKNSFIYNHSIKVHHSILIALLLFGIAALPYIESGNFSYVNWDDDPYIWDNTIVKGGLTVEGWNYAWDPSQDPYLMPVTRLGFMLQVQLFGIENPGAFHLVSVALHAINTLLVFWFLLLTTSRLWPSALVAALFAVHPLHVQGVAWISEQKELWSTLFGLLALIAYYYSSINQLFHSTAGRNFYLLTVLAFLLSLLAKPMWLTFPALLLVIDFWPLQRLKFGVIRSRIIEKLPFFFLSILWIIMSIRYMKIGENTDSFSTTPFSAGFTTIPASYCLFLWKSFFPVPLTMPYTLFVDEPPALWLWSGSMFLLLFISVILGTRWRNHPWEIAGWLWFLGTLSLVLFSVGSAQMTPLSDHWTYVPHIGLFSAIAFSLPLKASGWKQWLTIAIVIFAISVFSFMSWRQAATWKNSETLWLHNLAVHDGNNHFASFNLGNYYLSLNQYDKAFHYFSKALQQRPHEAYYIVNLGSTLLHMGRNEDAWKVYDRLLKQAPASYAILTALGRSAISLGHEPHGIAHLKKSIRDSAKTDPLNSYIARIYLGILLWLANKPEEARMALLKLPVIATKGVIINNCKSWQEIINDLGKVRPKILKIPLNLVPGCIAQQNNQK